MSDLQAPRSCGVLLVCGSPIRSFLLMRHVDRWDLPKGHVDPGESDIVCAMREMHEETGISPDKVFVDPDFLYVQQYEVQTTRYGGSGQEKTLKTLLIFLARVEKEYKIKLTEHIGFQWMPWKSPPDPIQERTIDPLLRQLDQHLNSNIDDSRTAE